MTTSKTFFLDNDVIIGIGEKFTIFSMTFSNSNASAIEITGEGLTDGTTMKLTIPGNNSVFYNFPLSIDGGFRIFSLSSTEVSVTIERS